MGFFINISRIIIVVYLLFSGMCFNLCAQNQDNTREIDKSLSEVNDLLLKNQFKQAINLSKKLLKQYPRNAEVYMAVGLGYINLSSHPDSAVYYLTKGLELQNDDEQMGELGINLQLSLGKALQSMLKPDRALEIYEKMLLRLPAEESQTIKEISREMELCNNAKVLIANPIAFSIKNMGSGINSAYDDHSPLSSINGEVLYFTSRRPGGDRSLQYDNQYPEKIWMSTTADQSIWTEAKNLKSFFKKNEHESAVSLSADGRHLFLFKNDPEGKNIYMSTLENSEWGIPLRLPFQINGYSDETHCSMSVDESTLYFTSNREGGYGGFDIYIVRRDMNGNWGEPQNAGKMINTPYNEETPMIYLDGRTLYFASEGHNSMGDFDIFYSQMNADSTWNEPVNMGFPINTPGDNMFFIPTIDKSKAYYATKKFSDSQGGMDIYMIEFDKTFSGKLSVIEGKVKQGDDYKVVRLLVTRTDNQQLAGDYVPDPKTGEYTLFLESGFRYQFKEIRQKTEEVVTGEIMVTDDMAFANKSRSIEMVKDVKMDPPLSQSVAKKEAPAVEMPKESIVSPGKVSQAEPVTVISTNKLGEPGTVVGRESTYQGGYTIQIMALRQKPITDYAIFKELDINEIREQYCSDKYYRYIYRVFDNKAEAEIGRQSIRKTGRYQDAFVRPMQQLEELKVKTPQ